MYITGSRTVEESANVEFYEQTPNLPGSGPNWLFDLEGFTKVFNPVLENVSGSAGTSSSIPTAESSNNDVDFRVEIPNSSGSEAQTPPAAQGPEVQSVSAATNFTNAPRNDSTSAAADANEGYAGATDWDTSSSDDESYADGFQHLNLHENLASKQSKEVGESSQALQTAQPQGVSDMPGINLSVVLPPLPRVPDQNESNLQLERELSVVP